MEKDKRYIATLSCSLWAKNDEEAKENADKIAEFLRTLEDNDAKVTSINEKPFASLKTREVWSM